MLRQSILVRMPVAVQVGFVPKEKGASWALVADLAVGLHHLRAIVCELPPTI